MLWWTTSGNRRYSARFRVHLRNMCVTLLLICTTVLLRQLTLFMAANSPAPSAVHIGLKRLFHQENSEAETLSPAHNSSLTCRERRHFAFLKVYKSGSSTVQNIFYRFGFFRNLTFLLPRLFNIISYFPVIKKENIIPPPKGKHFEAMCNHVMYNKTAFRLSLPTDSVYVGILRSPQTQMSSYLNYFHGRVFNGSLALEEYLANLDLYSSWPRPRKIFPNIMADYFGLPERYQKEAPRQVVSDFLMQIETDFDFIIILERLDESLLLMKRKFCWKLKDIVYQIKRGTALQKHRQPSKISLAQQHRMVAQVDFALYEHFSCKISNAVLSEQRETGDFKDELNYFQTILDVVRTFCASTSQRESNNILRVNGSKWSDSFEWTLSDCHLLYMEELEILDFIGQWQYGENEWKLLHKKVYKMH